MKITYVIDSLAPGGAERSLIEMLPHLVTRGIDPLVVSLTSTEETFEPLARSAGVRVVTLEAGSRLSTIRALRALFRRERPDLIHTTLFEADIAGRLAAVGSGIPVVGTLAGLTYEPERLEDPGVRPNRLRLARAMDGWTARRLTRRLHAVSGSVKRSAVRSLRVDPDRIQVIPRGRDPELLGEATPARRAAARAGLGLPDDAEVVLAVGRHAVPKGHRFLVQAMAAVRRPNVRLLLAGRTGAESAALRAIVSDLGLEGRVAFLGHRDDVPELLAASDVFALPSVSEGAGGALIEAMALGLPIVASDLPAVREAIRNDRSGLLVPPRDPVALTAAIERLLDDPAVRARLGSEARHEFFERFTIDIGTERMVELYRDVLGDRRPEAAEAPT
jgi:glycosyltransferase involved in cell wall biosynthesis